MYDSQFPRQEDYQARGATRGNAGIDQEAQGQVEIRSQNLDVVFVGRNGEGGQTS